MTDPIKVHNAAIKHATDTVREGNFTWYPCGFAEVRMPGNTAYARKLSRAGIISKAYGGGMRLRMPTLSQKMLYKEALCHAYIEKVSELMPGFEGYTWTHID